MFASIIQIHLRTTVRHTITQYGLTRVPRRSTTPRAISQIRCNRISSIQLTTSWPSVNAKTEFLLYLTGYAQFFGTDYDPWCTTEVWNIWVTSATPYITVELRTAFNDHVSKVNEIYTSTLEQKFAKQARFVDLDPGFLGHWICEPGASSRDQLNQQINFEKVYLWNLTAQYPPKKHSSSWATTA